MYLELRDEFSNTGIVKFNLGSNPYFRTFTIEGRNPILCVSFGTTFIVVEAPKPTSKTLESFHYGFLLFESTGWRGFDRSFWNGNGYCVLKSSDESSLVEITPTEVNEVWRKHQSAYLVYHSGVVLRTSKLGDVKKFKLCSLNGAYGSNLFGRAAFVVKFFDIYMDQLALAVYVEVQPFVYKVFKFSTEGEPLKALNYEISHPDTVRYVQTKNGLVTLIKSKDDECGYIELHKPYTPSIEVSNVVWISNNHHWKDHYVEFGLMRDRRIWYLDSRTGDITLNPNYSEASNI